MSKKRLLNILLAIIIIISIAAAINAILIFKSIAPLPTGFLLPTVCGNIVMNMLSDGMITSTFAVVALMIIFSGLPILIYLFLGFISRQKKIAALTLLLVFTILDSAFFITGIENFILNIVFKLITLAIIIAAYISLKKKKS